MKAKHKKMRFKSGQVSVLVDKESPKSNKSAS